ncbi:expressed unknown protein [Seminavis robusta]|uniref:SnoaL-like polyketide cyclase n=1 Tax=Seminavis robusta TaxID=568900 RepID=A0A9N8HG21_9STRA|nr:expressed unknown protein [Seminavis robusta]|eukprot:Sro553_g165200.1 n/a (198) ;mRNA; f:732-1325
MDTMNKTIKSLFHRKKSKSFVMDESVKCDNDSCDTATTLAEEPIPLTESWKIDAVKAFVEKWNQHDMEGARSMVTQDMVTVFASADNMELEYQDYAAEVNKLFEAFPDFSFKHELVEEHFDGKIVLHKMITSGHHTAKPYAFGPCPPIEATGKYVENSETIHFYFRGTKIIKQVVHADGEMTGPPGIYTQLGGFPAL